MINHLIQSAVFTIAQLKELLPALDNERYIASLPVFSGRTVGMHVRHIIEFYQCLLLGIAKAEVDYDARKRDLQLESDTAFAIRNCEQLISDISRIHENPSLTLLTGEDLNVKKIAIPSCFHRELTYVIEHTIHHFAIIKMGCSIAFPDIIFPADFGVAFSTIKHKASVHSNVPASV
jgi:hypothetical protein